MASFSGGFGGGGFGNANAGTNGSLFGGFGTNVNNNNAGGGKSSSPRLSNELRELDKSCAIVPALGLEHELIILLFCQ